MTKQHHCKKMEKYIGKSYIEKDEIGEVWYYTNDVIHYNQRIFYCPFCGEKLE
jgi:hypothetical protein